MAKKKVMYECLACGYESPKWLGKCPSCQAWNQMEEQLAVEVQTSGKTAMVVTSKHSNTNKALKLEAIQSTNEQRLATKFQEFDRVLGGGIVAGSLVLIGGDPGIGKSTLLLQVSVQLANSNRTVLYVSGEESLAQIKMRAERLELNGAEFYLMADTDLFAVASEIQRLEPDVVIIDSIQTMQIPDHQGVAGSVAQVREATALLMRVAKDNQIAIFIVGHVTKEGSIAGPRMLEHMVDAVLYFEGERHNRFRVLRAVKNRFGSTHELGVFEMLDVGLQEVTNPSELFLEERLEGATGSTVVASMEGTRPILAEIQSLMTPTVYGTAKRTSSGIDYQRVSLILAVMEKHCGLMVQNQDAFFKITGGVKLDEPAIDLAIAVSIASSYWNRATNIDDCFIGEIGLTGEIRRVNQINERVKEAQKLGFKRIFVPKNNQIKLSDKVDVEIVPVATIRQAVRLIFPKQA